MENLSYFFVAFVVLSTMLVMLVVWARRRLWIRALTVVALAVLLGLNYFALSDLLSRPKPVALEFLETGVDEAQVLAASLDEGEAIYLWLRLPDLKQPRYYRMLWQHEAAVQLQDAMREAERRRAPVYLRLPFEDSLDHREDPRFYAPPQPRLPLKPKPELQEYHHPSYE